MDDVQNLGAVEKPIENKEPEKVEAKDYEAIIAAKIDEVNRKWQSKFDTILGEKKAVEGKALTVEQQIEQLRQERDAERLSFIRDKAKMNAKIDDELEGAIRLYGSSKAEEINSGADGIRAYFAKLNEIHEADKQKAVEEALKKIGAQPRPQAGKDQKVLSLADFNKLTPRERAEYMASGGTVTD